MTALHALALVALLIALPFAVLGLFYILARIGHRSLPVAMPERSGDTQPARKVA